MLKEGVRKVYYYSSLLLFLYNRVLFVNCFSIVLFKKLLFFFFFVLFSGFFVCLFCFLDIPMDQFLVNM